MIKKYLLAGACMAMNILTYAIPKKTNGFNYKRFIFSDGLAYSEQSKNKCLIAKVFTKGPCKGQTHCVLIDYNDRNNYEFIPIDGSERQFTRMKNIFDGLYIKPLKK